MPRKRSGKRLETEQLNVRLPVEMVEALHRAATARRFPLSKEIRERLAGSFADDVIRTEDPTLPDLLNQICELSRRVRRHYGVGWHVDANALAAFKEIVGRLVADLPVPASGAAQGELNYPPSLVADVIYRGYVAERREYAETGTIRPIARPRLTPEGVRPVAIDVDERERRK